MRTCRLLALITAVLGCLVSVSLPLPAASGERDTTSEMVTVVPQEIDDLLANPGMGWETFHRTRDEDKNLPDWIPSTVHYARWGWGTIEPQPGKIDHAFLDGVLKQTRQAGQRLAFRVMCCSTTLGRPVGRVDIHTTSKKAPKRIETKQQLRKSEVE